MADAAIDRIVEAIARDGYAIAPDALPARHVTALREAARLRDARGKFVPAGVGRGAERIVRAEVRGDRICWIDVPDLQPCEARWFAQLETLRCSLNAGLMLGLLEFEGHYAIYPAGGSYSRHRDRFRDDDARVLSCVLYLNEEWGACDGGELRLFTGSGAVDIPPCAGTLVVFLSERFEHEVRATQRDRYAFTGWFRRRSL